MEEKVKKKMGRPLKGAINWESFIQMCQIHATQEEIACVFQVDVQTLQRRVKKEYGKTFEMVYAENTSKGKMSLRRQIWKRAMEGTDKRLIELLAKNYLGMADKVESKVESSVSMNAAVTIVDESSVRAILDKLDSEY